MGGRGEWHYLKGVFTMNFFGEFPPDGGDAVSPGQRRNDCSPGKKGAYGTSSPVAFFQILMERSISGEPRIFVQSRIPREYLLESRPTLTGEEEWTPIGSWQVPDELGRILLAELDELDHPVLFLRVRARSFAE